MNHAVTDLDRVFDTAMNTQGSLISAQEELGRVHLVEYQMDQQQERAYRLIRQIALTSSDQGSRKLATEAMRLFKGAEGYEAAAEQSVDEAHRDVQQANGSNRQVIGGLEEARAQGRTVGHAA